MKLKIDLEIARELLGKPKNEVDKKSAAALRKRAKELREECPIQIAVKFKLPWWCAEADSE